MRIEAGRLRRALGALLPVGGPVGPGRHHHSQGRLRPALRLALAAARGSRSCPSRPATGPAGRFAATAQVSWIGAVPRRDRCALRSLSGSLCGVPWRDGALRARPDSVPCCPGGPTLVVMPFAAWASLPAARTYADGLTEEVLSQFARFKEITVLGRRDVAQHPAGRGCRPHPP